MTNNRNDQSAQDAVEHREATSPNGGDDNPAGPHAADRLTDPQKTPGTGSLPDESAKEADVGPD